MRSFTIKENHIGPAVSISAVIITKIGKREKIRNLKENKETLKK